MYYDSRTTGIAMQPVTADKPAWLLSHQPERRMPEFREFYGSTMPWEHPMPGVTISRRRIGGVITGLWVRGKGYPARNRGREGGHRGRWCKRGRFFLSPA
jgi:hypothetical protein